jgi:hypothetical protein
MKESFGLNEVLYKFLELGRALNSRHFHNTPLFSRCRHSMFGVDHSFTMFSPSSEDKSDVIALSVGESDLVVASVVTGAMMDFSFAGGKMSVDETKMKEIYGPGVAAHSVMIGQIVPPPEMDELYAHINSMILVSFINILLISYI